MTTYSFPDNLFIGKHLSWKLSTQQALYNPNSCYLQIPWTLDLWAPYTKRSQHHYMKEDGNLFSTVGEEENETDTALHLPTHFPCFKSLNMIEI